MSRGEFTVRVKEELAALRPAAPAERRALLAALLRFAAVQGLLRSSVRITAQQEMPERTAVLLCLIGGFLALNDGTNVISTAFAEAQEGYNRSGAVPYHLRSPEQIAGFFEGLELLPPGVVSCPRWRPDPAAGGVGLPPEVDMFGGVARKP